MIQKQKGAGAGIKMNEIKFMPIGRTYPTYKQRMEARIKRLRYWVAILSVSNMIFTVLAVVMVLTSILK